MLNNKFKMFLFILLIFFVNSCNKIKKQDNKNNSLAMRSNTSVLDSLNIDICEYTKHIGYEKINPLKIWERDEITEALTEGFILSDSLKIIQLEKSKIKKGFIKRYYEYQGVKLKTKRIKSDSLNFDFDTILFDFSSSEEIYKKNNLVILINQPMGWSGLSNKYRFIQIIDLSNKICLEAWVDYYSCLGIRINQ